MDIFVKLWFYIHSENALKVLSLPLSVKARKVLRHEREQMFVHSSISVVLHHALSQAKRLQRSVVSDEIIASKMKKTPTKIQVTVVLNFGTFSCW